MQGLGQPPAEAGKVKPNAPARVATEAIIDIGSNSGRMVVLQAAANGYLQVIEDAHASLQLVNDLDEALNLAPAGMERVMQALREFRALADAAGVTNIRTLATSAVREAHNSGLLAQQMHADLGLELQVLSAEDEGRYAFLGAVYALPVDHGLLVDMGGGSLQAMHFHDRRCQNIATLRLGALRLTRQFLAHDPPTASERRELVAHVQNELGGAGVPHLVAGEQLIGTGGTFRTLARIDRKRRKYPLSRPHGYQLQASALHELAKELAQASPQDRAAIPGLNSDRVESVVAGALCLSAVAQYADAESVLISGQGLREGAARAELWPQVPEVDQVQWASLRALTGQFAGFDTARAERRQALAAELARALLPDAPPEHRLALEQAAWALDIGRAIDYYNRHDHTATALMDSSPAGFSHRDIALVAAVVLRAETPKNVAKAYHPPLTQDDDPVFERLGAVLALADVIERHRLPAAESGVRCRRLEDVVLLRAPIADSTAVAETARREQSVLGRVIVEPADADR